MCDACLGAAGLGDIGRHFPDSDAQYKDIDSRVLLRRVRAQLAAAGWRVQSLDSTVLAQAPRLAPYFPRMTEHIAVDLGIMPAQVNVKATTTERTRVRRPRGGITAHAVVVLVADVKSA